MISLLSKACRGNIISTVGKNINIGQISILVFIGFFAVGFLAGCAETTASSDTIFYVWPDAATLSVGDERQFYALTVSSGTISNVVAAFSTSGNIGTITSTGLFSAEAEGTGTIIASYASDIASVTITVEATP